MIRVIRDASGLIFIDGREDPIAGGLQATLNGNLITIANTQGGRSIACEDFSLFADQSYNGFASPAEAMAYLALVFSPQPSSITEAVAAAAITSGMPLVTSRATGGMIQARADTYILAFVTGLALADAAEGFPAQAGRGAITLQDWSGIAGTPSLNQGQPYFLAPQGGLTAVALNPLAVCVARVGLASSPKTLIVAPHDPILL